MLSVLAVIGLIFLILLLVIVYQSSKTKWADARLSGPRQYPLIGNMIDILSHSNKLLDLLRESQKKYGDTIRIKIPFQDEWTIVLRAEEVEHILKTNFDNYVKGEEFVSRFHDVLGNGIFTADGDSWHQQRKIASNIFSINNFKDNMLVVFCNHVNYLSDRIAELEPSQSIDMQDMFHRFTMDSFCEIAFGVNLNSLRKKVAFTTSLDWAQTHCSLRFFRPLWQWSPYEWQQKKHVKIINNFCKSVVLSRMEEAKDKGIAHRHDLLSLFMGRTNVDGKPFSETYLRDVIANFVLAGRDTTAQMLSWTFWLLSQHPEVEAKLFEEIQKELPGDSEFSFDASRRMHYTSAVLHEALRLYPSVPKDVVYAVNDDVLPNGIKINAGTPVGFAPYVMGRDPNNWENPLEFNPSRWIGDDGNLIKVSPFKYPVFKAGPRTCLGQNMAILEAQCVLASLHKRFIFKMAPNAPEVKYKDSATLPMMNGLYMVATQRKSKIC